MKLSAVIIFLSIFLFSLPHSTFASGEYYVEIGSELAEEEAIEQWRVLSRKYPGTLGMLEFYPTTVVHKHNNRVTTRIQAGPLTTKLDAYRICGTLFDDNMPCFVVEGMDHESTARRTAKQLAARKVKPEPLPWLVKKKQKQINPEPSGEIIGIAKSKKEEKGLFAWIVDGLTFSDDTAITSRDLEPVPKGDVQVAEAIRVPLSGAAIAAPKIGFADKNKVVEPFSASSHARLMANESGWLMVKTFNSDRRALAFWRALHSKNSIKMEGLTMRIIRPLRSRRKANVRLHMGPFSGLSEADRFCRTMVRGKNKHLQCRFLSQKEVEMLGDRTISTTRPTRSERYNKRRNGRERISMFNRGKPKKVYWLHVATTKTQMRALQTWDALRKKHADLLEGLRSSVSATLSKSNRYMLRIGPLASGSAASELCSLLHKRKLFCRVYSNM